MAGANITIRLDPGLKKAAEELYADLGLNLSTAIVMFLKASLAYDGIPFEVKRIPDEEMKMMLAEYEEIMSNLDSYKHYYTAKDLIFEVLLNV
jgi:DNA-damage-inducible protein J